jgi:hypothetical protein
MHLTILYWLGGITLGVVVIIECLWWFLPDPKNRA